MAVYVQGLGCISTPKDASKRFKYLQYTAGLEVRMRQTTPWQTWTNMAKAESEGKTKAQNHQHQDAQGQPGHVWFH